MGIIIIPTVVQVVLGLYSLNRQPEAAAVETQTPRVLSDKSTWPSHTDVDNKFSILYPTEMYPAEKPFSNFAVTFLIKGLESVDFPPDMAPRIQIYVTEKPVGDFVKEVNEARNKEQFPEFSPIELNGYTAYQTKALDQSVIFTHTIISSGKKTYLIEIFSTERDNKVIRGVYDEMLKSFKILE
jgi:hypothetical protein